MNYQKWERPKRSRLKLDADMRAFLRRRTMPFLNDNGVDRPLSFLLEEAYLQGMRDATQVLTGESEGDAADASANL